MGRFIILCSIVTIMCVSSWVAAQVGPSNLKRGQVLYAQHCARCHGSNGNGLGPDAQHLIVPPANFNSPGVRNKTDAELLTAISSGVLFSAMHGWRDRLSEREMMDIVGYVRMLSPFNPIS
ncbi:MAG: cytochrome c [Nitrospira sp.]|nr:cytochrome c [Nitrospira sp.]